jgi:hypothetical protein
MPSAWEPFTPRGVAAFAKSSFSRLLLVETCMAVLAAAAVVWFLDTAWFPVIAGAIARLPETGEIHSRKLVWRGQPTEALAQNRFLAVTVDLKHEGKARSPAHIQAEFGEGDLRLFSLFGYIEIKYPNGWAIAFNRAELQPWWGAWKPEILAITVGIVMASLLAAWSALATLYCPLAWLAAFFANRELDWGGSWRLAGSALMPGAFFLTAAIMLYGFGLLDVVRLLSAGVLNLALGWAYIVLAPFWLLRHPDAPPRSNPFRSNS